MVDPRGRRRRRAGLWALGLCLIAAALLAARPLWLQGWQERAFDALILTAPLPAAGAVTVIDIGRGDENGDPWSRAASARLAARLAEAGPRVIGWDIVFAGGCGPEAANLALAATLGRAPNVLGFLLANRPEALPGPSPQLALSASAAPHLWAAPGAEGPCPGFVAPSVTLGGISLPGDAQARVRAVPVALAAGGVAWPSLVLEVWRRAQGGGTPLLGADRQGALALRLGDAALALDHTATLRFQPRNRAARAARTLEAAEVLRGAADPARLAGRIVLVGSSLPQAGGCGRRRSTRSIRRCRSLPMRWTGWPRAACRTAPPPPAGPRRWRWRSAGWCWQGRSPGSLRWPFSPAPLAWPRCGR